MIELLTNLFVAWCILYCLWFGANVYIAKADYRREQEDYWQE